jgi:L-ascorbate metabolism protein UlaG (beta-lactamase superfamily)
VSISSYGQRSLLIQGGGQSVLLNPYKAVGCAAGLPEPRLTAGVVLANSELADEGARDVAGGRFLAQPGSYRIGGLSLEGFANPHDRVGGRRFGNATLWRWQQGGLSFAHLGATAGELTAADKVLLGNPDVLIIGVGGGSKIYDADEAAAVVEQLNPKRVIPVQYVNGEAPEGCDQEGVQPFLDAMGGTAVRRVGQSQTLPGRLDGNTVITVMQ